MIRSRAAREHLIGRRRRERHPPRQEESVTVPAHAALVAVPDLASAMAVLRAAGLRLSRARRTVLATLFESATPLTAEDIARTAACDLASVYRNLAPLARAGVVRHLHLGHGAGVYLPAADATELVVCERCGARADIDPRVTADVRAAVRAATGFTPRFDHFPLAGLCPRCADDPDR